MLLLDSDRPAPLPDDPLLAEVASVVRDAGDWAWVVDRDWRVRYVTDEQRIGFNAGVGLAPFPIGVHMFGPEMLATSADWKSGPNRPELWERLLVHLGGFLLTDAGGDTDVARADVDPTLHTALDALEPSEATASSGEGAGWFLGREFRIRLKTLRIRDAAGEVRGTLLLLHPAVGTGVVNAMAFALDPGHLERMVSLARSGRMPAAILFGDLEGSSALSRKLSTANYFAVVRRILRAADQCVVDEGGLVGRHVGDGVTAFFPLGAYSSESEAAAACIATAQAVREAMAEVAARSGLEPEGLVVRFGLHWGSTLYIGNVTTAARSEVVALGDEANEAARIEACATGGLTLASKALVERLDPDDATRLGIDPDRVTYTQLSDLTTATEKARRDAPAIAVCEL